MSDSPTEEQRLAFSKEVEIQLRQLYDEAIVCYDKSVVMTALAFMVGGIIAEDMEQHQDAFNVWQFMLLSGFKDKVNKLRVKRSDA